MTGEQKAIIESPDNATLQEDIDRIAEAFPFAGDFSGKTVLVTGSTGLIGSQVVKAFAAINRKKDTAVRILAQARNEKKAEKVFGTLLKRGDVELVTGDVQEQLPIDGGVDFIVHGAAPTGSRFFVEKPVETIHAILGGTEILLELAKEKQVSAMVFLSSLEVYGTPQPQQEWMGEQDFGNLDPAQVRSSYSEGKRMAECLCVSYAKEYGVPVIPARLSQTFGPGVHGFCPLRAGRQECGAAYGRQDGAHLSLYEGRCDGDPLPVGPGRSGAALQCDQPRYGSVDPGNGGAGL